MSYRQLFEGATNLLIGYIQTHIGASLDKVAASVGVPHMTLENPKSYFIYAKPKATTLPAVFVIAEEIDLRIKEMKSNFINASDRFMVSCLVEDDSEDMITPKAWRYGSALHEVLDEADIDSQDGKLSLRSVVYRIQLSPTFARTEGTGDGGKFRKEIVLECQVEHYENN